MHRQIFYLSHPSTTYGDFQKNELLTRTIQQILRMNGHIIISPLDIIPHKVDWVEAMEISSDLFNVCSALIIASKKWIFSDGCTEEVRWALQDNKPIYVYHAAEMQIVEVTEAQRKQLQWMVENREKGKKLAMDTIEMQG